MQVLEQDGAGKVTIRRVATELDTGPASLYVYVANTTVLHGLIIDRLLAGLDLEWDGTEPWRERLERALGDYMRLLTDNAEFTRTVPFVWPDGPHYLDLVELLLRLLDDAGVERRAAAWAVDFLIQNAGVAAAEWSARAKGTGQDLEDLAATFSAADQGRHPTLVAFGPELLVSGTPQERIRWALDTFLTGLTP